MDKTKNQSFKKLQESLVEGDVSSFHKVFSGVLEENIKNSIIALNEMNEEERLLTKIAHTAKMFGALPDKTITGGGMVRIVFTTKDQARHFFTWISRVDNIESVTLNILSIDTATGQHSPSPVSFDNIEDDTLFNFEVIVFLKSMIMGFKGHEGVAPCSPGFYWNGEKCVPFRGKVFKEHCETKINEIKLTEGEHRILTEKVL